MDQICLVMPLLPGSSDDARDFMDELEHHRSDEYRRSEERIGISREAWFLGSGTGETTLIAYIESDDFAQALGLFSTSREDFDVWFKHRLCAVTGVDLNDPPEMTLPELLSSYVAADRAQLGAAGARTA